MVPVSCKALFSYNDILGLASLTIKHSCQTERKWDVICFEMVGTVWSFENGY